ncbi:MAG: bifunctional pyr operon transcriptional regulator/uracil phosphoribosyltransferase PyrR [Verrucomicrobia bacterium]|nr:bifunctional pyr operon transcriptional regulator/uracil phosphoribosyltransferase PyrR [Verrucomicrobiota bacterium]
MSKPQLVMDAGAIGRALTRMAGQIAQCNGPQAEVVLVGVQTGGVTLATHLAAQLKRLWGHDVPVGELDISMHRDDLGHQLAPKVHPTSIPFDVAGKTVVLTDDVLYSGRTTRAALDALNDLGRPKRIQLAVLIDRGHRELPIAADFVGKKVATAPDDQVEVQLAEGRRNWRVLLEKPRRNSHRTR